MWARTAGCNSRHRIEMLDQDRWSRSKTPGSPAPHRWRGSASELESRWGGCHHGRAWPLTAWPPRSRPSASRTHWHLQTPIRNGDMTRGHVPRTRKESRLQATQSRAHRQTLQTSCLRGPFCPLGPGAAWRSLSFSCTATASTNHSHWQASWQAAKFENHVCKNSKFKIDDPQSPTAMLKLCGERLNELEV